MNKTEIINRVAERSGVNREECEKVIDSFEKVLEDELSNSKGLGGAFDKIYNVLHYFKGKKIEKDK